MLRKFFSNRCFPAILVTCWCFLTLVWFTAGKSVHLANAQCNYGELSDTNKCKQNNDTCWVECAQGVGTPCTVANTTQYTGFAVPYWVQGSEYHGAQTNYPPVHCWDIVTRDNHQSLYEVCQLQNMWSTDHICTGYDPTSNCYECVNSNSDPYTVPASGATTCPQ
jgi:hypothetical protein